MPIIKSAVKRMHQTEKRRVKNEKIKHVVKSSSKAFAAKPSFVSLRKAQSELDKAVKKGLIKKNTAARRKAAIYKAGKTAGVKLEKVAKATKPVAAKKQAEVKKAVAKKPAAKKTAKK